MKFKLAVSWDSQSRKRNTVMHILVYYKTRRQDIQVSAMALGWWHWVGGTLASKRQKRTHIHSGDLLGIRVKRTEIYCFFSHSRHLPQTKKSSLQLNKTSISCQYPYQRKEVKGYLMVVS